MDEQEQSARLVETMMERRHPGVAFVRGSMGAWIAIRGAGYEVLVNENGAMCVNNAPKGQAIKVAKYLRGLPEDAPRGVTPMQWHRPHDAAS